MGLLCTHHFANKLRSQVEPRSSFSPCGGRTWGLGSDIIQPLGHPPDHAVVHPVLPGDAGHRQAGEDLLPHLRRLLGGQHRRTADALPLGPGPLLALDAALPDVAPLPLGDGQGEVQQELAGGGGGVELPLGEDHQVDAGVRSRP